MSVYNWTGSVASPLKPPRFGKVARIEVMGPGSNPLNLETQMHYARQVLSAFKNQGAYQNVFEGDLNHVRKTNMRVEQLRDTTGQEHLCLLTHRDAANYGAKAEPVFFSERPSGFLPFHLPTLFKLWVQNFNTNRQNRSRTLSELPLFADQLLEKAIGTIKIQLSPRSRFSLRSPGIEKVTWVSKPEVA